MRTIAVTGAHAVGKTLLCNRLVQALESIVNIKMIPEVARLLISRGIPMNEKVSEHGIVTYIYEYLKLCRLTKADLVISDRSVFDLLAYISVSRPTEVRDTFVKLTEEIVYQEVARTDVYVYTPIEFEMVVDDVRPADSAYQVAIDEKVRNLLGHFGARTLTVRGTIDERVKAVREYLNV
jgi:predicted ATPase